jgi:two-component system osmolarity sensor histidine kinase EnvZ
LGRDTITARSVNGQEGLWVGFRLGDDMFWLQLNPDRLSSVSGSTWLAWAGIAALLSLAGAAALAGWLNRPLQQLLKAMLRLSQGQFDAAVLNEHVATAEIRQLNQSFNQMAGQLSRAEQDRALMLAGISHDLRTPLARLRLETEMSVSDATARQYMAADIEQMDGIIGKFLDYARPQIASLQPVNVCQLLRQTQQQLAGLDDVVIDLQLPTTDVWVQADAVDLQRIMDNLIENARRYGKTEGTDVAKVLVRCQWGETHASIEVIDQGPGVDAGVLANMTQPFFRADTARSQAQGAGLGLAMVARIIGRMHGHLVLQSPVPAIDDAHEANLPKPCGLLVRLELPVQGGFIRKNH